MSSTVASLRREHRRTAVIGYGAIAEAIVSAFKARGELSLLVGILGRSERVAALRDKAQGRFPVLSRLDALLALQPDIVIEAAGHGAVMEFGAEVLASGVDLLIASTGALANRDVAARLARSLNDGASVRIAAGAVAGLDGIAAARTCGLTSVTYTSIKHPRSWIGTAAEALLDPATMDDRLVFFEGTAREAALTYPRNANVAAAIALAGLGLERTAVRLGADPHVAGPLGIIDASGAFGRFHFDILGLASPSNAKTSAITGHSLAAAALDGMCFRVDAAQLTD